ncbi:MAG: response regulator transcription factor [Methylotenera sp.]|nr:response regulator transcription factor [Methylotenera sp.]
MSEALAAGVQGYLLIRSSPVEVLRCVHALAAGTPYLSDEAARCVPDGITQARLTAQETRVLALLAEGLSNKAIARQLAVGPTTVKTHGRAVPGKLGVTNRTQAALVARQRGLRPPGSAQGCIDPGAELR